MASMLEAIQAKMPVANQKLQQQQKAARDLQLQQAVSAMPAAASVQQPAAWLGTAMQQQAGQQQVQQAQSQQQQQQQVGQLALGQQAQQTQAQLSTAQTALQKQGLSDEARFAALAGKSKGEIFDARKKFAQDEMGRKFLNERQLADYARMSAASDEELRDYAQTSEQLTQKQVTAMEFAAAKIDQELRQQQALGAQKQDQALMRELTQAKIALEKRIAKERADYANKVGMYSTIGTVGGAALGSLGGPAGAMAGASIGGGLGTVLASQGV